MSVLKVKKLLKVTGFEEVQELNGRRSDISPKSKMQRWTVAHKTFYTKLLWINTTWKEHYEWKLSCENKEMGFIGKKAF